ncbi:Uncharacterised protein, partial [Mycoplasma putrefaciens]
MVINKEVRVSKTGRKIFYLDLTDNKSSIRCVYFSKSDKLSEFDELTEEELNSDHVDELKQNKIDIGDW